MIIETCNRSRGINDAWAQASREFVIHRRIENPLRVIRSSLTGGVNRTAMVVAPVRYTLHRIRVERHSVSGEWTRFRDKLYWPRRWNSTRAEYLSKFSPTPPPSVHPSFLHEFQLAGRRSEWGEMVGGVVLETRKKTTNVPSTFNPRLNETVFFSFSIYIELNNGQ